MNVILLALLYAVSVRAFLFEIKFNDLRTKIATKHQLFDTFLSCPFCNGFWTGLFTYFILVWHPIVVADLYTVHFIHTLFFAVSVGFIGWLQAMHTNPWNSN